MSFTCGNLSIFFSNVKKTSRDMRQQKIYEANDKMITLIKDNYNTRVEYLIGKADDAMYSVKKSGKSNYAFIWRTYN